MLKSVFGTAHFHPHFTLRLLSIVLLGLAFNAHSKETFRIGVEDYSYYPLYDFSRDRQSLLKDILNEFAEQHQFQFEYVPLPIKRFKSWYSKAKIDFRAPDNPYWRHDKNASVIFSQPIHWISAGTVVLKSAQLKPMSDFQVVGIFNGFIPSEHWRDALRDKKIDLVQASSVKLLTQYLYKGMVDGINNDINTIRHEAALLGFDINQLVVSETVPKVPFAYSLSTINHPDVLDMFNRFLVKESAKIAAIKARYGLKHSPYISDR